MSKNDSSRRKFLKTTVRGAIITGVSSGMLTEAFAAASNTKTPNTLTQLPGTFTQQPLPYGYAALENVIDAMTMEIHYTKHAAAYSKNLIEAAQAENANNKTLEEILSGTSKYSTKMRNNAGGHYNHEMFWQSMRPKRDNNMPTGKLMDKITKSFGSFDAFKTQFSDAGKNRFGSGWAWLYIDSSKNLKIGSTPNQDNPLMDVSDLKGFPLLGLDVWEHAYYLKYQNRRPEYIQNWWQVVNWDYVASRMM